MLSRPKAQQHRQAFLVDGLVPSLVQTALGHLIMVDVSWPVRDDLL